MKLNPIHIILSLLLLGAIVTVIILAPITQDQAYHNFSDDKELGGIKNFWNVISNLPFLFVGVWGLVRLNAIEKFKNQYATFFVGVALVAIGSAYYHLKPTNDTLIWDRLPMTIGFMSLFSVVISEYLDEKRGTQLLIPLLFIGTLSIVHWSLFDDLSAYILVQFYPLLAIPIILIFNHSKTNHTFGYWILIGFYAIAKICEVYDGEILESTGSLSGHSLKHLFAATGIGIFLQFAMRPLKRSAK